MSVVARPQPKGFPLRLCTKTLMGIRFVWFSVIRGSYWPNLNKTIHEIHEITRNNM